MMATSLSSFIELTFAVILSAAKNLTRQSEILSAAKNDSQDGSMKFDRLLFREVESSKVSEDG